MLRYFSSGSESDSSSEVRSTLVVTSSLKFFKI